MKVKDLIADLMQYPDDMNIVGASDKCDYPMCVYVRSSYMDIMDKNWAENSDGVKVVVIETHN